MNIIPNNWFNVDYISIAVLANSLFGAIMQILKGQKW